MAFFPTKQPSLPAKVALQLVTPLVKAVRSLPFWCTFRASIPSIVLLWQCHLFSMSLESPLIYTIILIYYPVLNSKDTIYDSYLNGVACLAAKPELNTELEPWQLLPQSYEDICQYICIVGNLMSTDNTRQHRVVYSLSIAKQEADMTSFYCFSLRLHMFLGWHNLALLGNWDSDEHGSTLGTDTPPLAAFQYSLTIQCT